jgi:RHS repeat-associated protein
MTESVPLGGSPYTFLTAKERDNESNLDYFGARYFSGAQGRFTGPDPVMSAPERLRDPQQFNRYAYARNNPLRFIDPTGERLQLSGDINEAQKQLCEILGTSDCASRITYDQKTTTITVDLTGIDLAKNEGAQLLDDLVASTNVYNLTLDSQFLTAGGLRSLASGSPIANLDNLDTRLGRPTAFDRPPKGVDDIVAINPQTAKFLDSKGRKVPLSMLILHELAEAYAKVDLGKQYSDADIQDVQNEMIVIRPGAYQGAHQNAVSREFKLRIQRPNLQLSGRAGDQLIRDPKP